MLFRSKNNNNKFLARRAKIIEIKKCIKEKKITFNVEKDTKRIILNIIKTPAKNKNEIKNK